MRPSSTTEKPLVLGVPPSPGSSRHSTPHSGGGSGGGALRTGAFGPPPGGFAPAQYDADAYGQQQPREARGSRGAGDRRASAVEVGGARRSTHADGRAREWDESSSEESD